MFIIHNSKILMIKQFNKFQFKKVLNLLAYALGKGSKKK